MLSDCSECGDEFETGAPRAPSPRTIVVRYASLKRNPDGVLDDVKNRAVVIKYEAHEVPKCWYVNDGYDPNLIFPLHVFYVELCPDQDGSLVAIPYLNGRRTTIARLKDGKFIFWPLGVAIPRNLDLQKVKETIQVDPTCMVTPTGCENNGCPNPCAWSMGGGRCECT